MKIRSSKARALFISILSLFICFAHAGEVEDNFPDDEWVSKVKYNMTSYSGFGYLLSTEELKLFERPASFRKDKTNSREERRETWAVLSTVTYPGMPTEVPIPPVETHQYLQITRKELTNIKKNLRNAELMHELVIREFNVGCGFADYSYFGARVTFRNKSQYIMDTCTYGLDQYPIIDDNMRAALNQILPIFEEVKQNGLGSPN